MNSKLVFLLLLFGYINSITFKCPSEKIKAKGICAIYDETNDELLIFSKCEDQEVCSDIFSEYLYTCINLNPFKFQKTGESCTFNEECEEGECLNGKCSNKCKKKCDKDYECMEEGMCVKYAEENDDCDYVPEKGYSVPCQRGDKCIQKKCRTFGSLSDGEFCGFDEAYCQSGLQYNGVCISLEKEPKCLKEGDIDVKVNGFENLIQVYCEKYGNVFSPEISVAKSNFFKDTFMTYLRQIKYNYNYYDDSKLKEYIFVLSYFDILLGQGIIARDGKPFDSKKCEYDFILKYIDSQFIKYRLVTLVGFLFLLI